MSKQADLRALSAAYDRLYEQADLVLQKHDPCQIRREADDTISCTETRLLKIKNSQLCCTGCEHLGPTGCTVKSLICKLWLCSTVKHDPACRTALWNIKDAADKQGVPIGFYRTPKDVAMAFSRA